MQRYIVYLFGFIVAACMVSCEKDIEVYYDEVPRIYFTVDSVNYSFGDQPFNIQEYEYSIPVKIMGRPLSGERQFMIEVIEEETTSKEGVTHAVLGNKFSVLTDSVNAYIPVTLLRAGISGEDMEKISLRIVEGGDFKTGVKESLEMMLTFNNYLEKPEWWGWMEYYLGIYQQEKYQKYIEIHGSSIDGSYVGGNFLKVLKEFKQVKAFFDAHPEYGISFPDDVSWPV